MRLSRDTIPLLSLTCGFGVVFLARNALGYLSPFLVADLHLANRSIGVLAATYSLAWAVSGFVLTALARRPTERRFLIWLMFGLGIASLASSAAATFVALFVTRLLSGAMSGPIFPLMQSQAAPLGSDAHRGFRMGVVQGVGSTVLGAVFAPLMLIPIASRWGWRAAFLPIALLAIFSALLLRYALPSASRNRGAPEPAVSGRPAARISTHANILLCSLIGPVMLGWLIISLTFYPLYLVTVQGRSATEMGTLMSVTGVSSLVAMLLVPHLSDRFGRRRVMSAFALLGIVGPLSLLLPHQSLPLLAISLFVGSLAGGIFPLFLAVIPSETVPAEQLPTTIGLIQGISEIAGGVALPVAAGWAADRFGLQAPLLITLISTLLASLLALAIRETDRRASTQRA